MDTILFFPPIAFILVLAVTVGVSALLSKLAIRPAKHSAGETKAYACGEDVREHRVRPEYSQFFPFAFFFTIMHVVALIVATTPVGNAAVSIMAVFYVLVAAVGLFILYRN